MFWLLIAWYQQNNIRFRNLAQYTRETYTIRLGVRLTGLVLGRSPAGFVQKFANQFFRPESNVLCSSQISFNLIFSQDTQLQNKYFQNSLMSTMHSLWLLNIGSASWERLFLSFDWLFGNLECEKRNIYYCFAKSQLKVFHLASKNLYGPLVWFLLLLKIMWCNIILHLESL